jgi:hypothetical protein
MRPRTTACSPERGGPARTSTRSCGLQEGRVAELFVVEDAERWGIFDPEMRILTLRDAPGPGVEDLLNLAVIDPFDRRGAIWVVKRGRAARRRHGLRDVPVLAGCSRARGRRCVMVGQAALVGAVVGTQSLSRSGSVSSSPRAPAPLLQAPPVLEALVDKPVEKLDLEPSLSQT